MVQTKSNKSTKKKRTRKLFLLILLLIIISPFISVLYSNSVFTVSRYSVSDKKIPKTFFGYKIAVISDLHCKQYGKNNTMLIERVNKEAPDIILFCGDIVSSDTEDFSFLEILLDKLQKFPMYYVFGNHELALSDSKISELKSVLEYKNVSLINDKKIVLEKNGETINLYGLCQSMYFYSGFSENGNQLYEYKTSDMTKALGQPSLDEFNVLLTHNPMYAKTYADYGADLTISGHIHGGVIRLPFKGGVLSPNNEYFPEYCAGEYEVSEKILIVSRGLGEHGISTRFNNPGDLCVIVLG